MKVALPPNSKGPKMLWRQFLKQLLPQDINRVPILQLLSIVQLLNSTWMEYITIQNLKDRKVQEELQKSRLII